MSIFVPFKAFRPITDKVEDICSRPYDVLNSVEAREAAKGNRNSFYHVIKPEIDFPEDYNHYAPEIYKKGKENFDRLVAKGLVKQDNLSSFYVYQLEMDGHVQTGLVGCSSIDDYFNNVIKKHELTRPDKEEDRKNHVRYSHLNYEPVFFAYPHNNSIDSLVNTVLSTTPEYNIITPDGIRHALWPISDVETAHNIQRIFKEEIPDVYVADGHHRTAAGAIVGKEMRDAANGNPNDGHRYNYLMSVLFPDNQLKIIDYNRVVRDLNGLSEEEFIQKISDNFTVEKKDGIYRPEEMHDIGMFLASGWYKLTAKEGTYNSDDPVGVLDVTILSKHILEPLLAIVDLRRDTRIDFIGGIRGLEELEKRVRSGEMKAAFAMHPVSMNQLMSIADNDMLMPPKVTWFEPKLQSGLFMHNLAD